MEMKERILKTFEECHGSAVQKRLLRADPRAKRNCLSLVCCKLLCAVAAPHVYEAVTATFTCAGNEFTAKGKTILTPGWKEIERRFKASFRVPTRRQDCWQGSCRRSPRARPLTRRRPVSPSISPRRPSPTPKIRFCPL